MRDELDARKTDEQLRVSNLGALVCVCARGASAAAAVAAAAAAAQR